MSNSGAFMICLLSPCLDFFSTLLATVFVERFPRVVFHCCWRLPAVFKVGRVTRTQDDTKIEKGTFFNNSRSYKLREVP